MVEKYFKVKYVVEGEQELDIITLQCEDNSETPAFEVLNEVNSQLRQEVGIYYRIIDIEKVEW